MPFSSGHGTMTEDMPGTAYDDDVGGRKDGARANASGCPCSHPCPTNSVTSTFMEYGESFRFKRGEVLWEAGDAADSVVVPCVGVFKLAVPRGERFATLELVPRGGMIGEEAAISDSTRPVRCEALTSGRGVRLSSTRLHALLNRKPQMREHLLQLSTTRARRFAERLTQLGDGRVKRRMAEVVLELGDQLGLADARGLFVPVRLSRGEMADMAGCRVETAIRVLSAWQREGLVEAQREGLVIKDRPALEVVAQS